MIFDKACIHDKDQGKGDEHPAWTSPCNALTHAAGENKCGVDI